MRKRTVLLLLLTIAVLLLSGCHGEMEINPDGGGSFSFEIPYQDGKGFADISDEINRMVSYYNSTEGVERLSVKKLADKGAYAEVSIGFKNIRFLYHLSKITKSLNPQFYFDKYGSLIEYNYNDILIIKDAETGEVSDISDTEKYKHLSALIIKDLDIMGLTSLKVTLPGKVKYVSASGVNVNGPGEIEIIPTPMNVGVIGENGEIEVQSRNVIKKAFVLYEDDSFNLALYIILGVVGAMLATAAGLGIKFKWFSKLKKSHKLRFIIANYELYLLVAPGVILFILFSYMPMFGLVLGLKNYSPFYGIWGSETVGLKNFIDLFDHVFFWRMTRNTVGIALLKFIFGFPAPIIFALLLNELKNGLFKRAIQTVSYLPHFISWMIISGMAFSFLSTDQGIINQIIIKLGGQKVYWYSDASKWWGIFTVTSIWKGMGWGSIIYLASITSINPELYEAAEIDGAGRFSQTRYITLPGMMYSIGIMLIFSLGGLIKDDFEQIYALVGTNQLLAERTDVYSTWIYKTVTTNFSEYGVATALGLLQGLISLIIMVIANYFVKKSDNPGLW